MSYKVKMDIGISLKDKETLREVMIKRDILSIPISKKTLDYIRDNYFDHIVEIIDLTTNEQIEKSPVIKIEVTEDIVVLDAPDVKSGVEPGATLEIKDLEIGGIPSVVEAEVEEVKVEENKALDDGMTFLEEFDISDDEIDSIMNMTEDVDKIFINDDEGKENIVEETVTPKVVKASENPKVESNEIQENAEVSDDDLDIDAVLDFFADDDPYSPNVESMSKIIKS